jgi:signal transduction histidine kinase
MANATVQFDELPVLPSNPELFSGILNHLVSNSLKFRNTRVPLLIRIGYTQAENLHHIPNVLRDTPYGILSVSDNGLGFEESEAEKIFGLFYKCPGSSSKGSGVGLAACRKIMKMHNGFITAEGQPGTGANFKLYFPLK